MSNPYVVYPKWVKVGFLGGLTFVILAAMLSLLDYVFDLEFLWYASFLCVAIGLLLLTTSLQYAQQYMINSIKEDCNKNENS